MKSEVELITPEMAKHWLTVANTNNRSLSQSHVADLARMMASGQWILSGQTISFDENGRLVDGQHRLSAVVKSGVSAPFLVVRGVPSNAFAVIDVGRNRSAGTIAQLSKLQDPSTVVAITRVLMALRDRRFFTQSAHYLPSEIVKVAKAIPEIQEAAHAMRSRFNQLRHLIRSSVAGSALVLTGLEDRGMSEEFWTATTTGSDLAQGSPILALRNRAMNEQKGKASSLRQCYLFACVWHAWSMHRTGGEINKLVISNPEVNFERSGGYKTVDRLFAMYGMTAKAEEEQPK
jgi:hypothetical protein